MSSINSIVLTGRLTKDPDMSAIPNTDTMVARFSIAVNEYYNKEEKVSFFNAVAYGKIAEFMQSYISKGNLIGLKGVLRQNRWQDNNGHNRSDIQIIVEKIEILQGDPR